MSSETISLPLLQPYKLDTPIPVAYLIPDWVTEQESNYLLLKIEELGGQEIESETAGRTFKSKPQGWKEVNGRRLQTWGGQVLPKSSTLIPTPLPSFMTSAFPHILGRVKSSTGAFEQAKGQGPNHVLVNEYLPGQGIMPHQDGSSYYPVVSTLSLGSHTILDLYEYSDEENEEGGRAINQDPLCSVFIPARSLFVLTGDQYAKCLHGIAQRHVDTAEQAGACVNAPAVTSELERSRRVSLTMHFDDGGARKLEATMPASYTGVQSEGTAAPVALDSMQARHTPSISAILPSFPLNTVFWQGLNKEEELQQPKQASSHSKALFTKA